MNYFEVHNGDWELATSHLSACEEGILLRLRRRYYATEKPLDSDVSKLQRLVRARTKDEKQAVVDVLEEFFLLRDDAWHDEKINRTIQEFLAGAPEREVKKANEDNRLKRHREERARLFKIITDAGEHAPWNVPIAELRELAKRIAESALAPETATPPATATATPATANHSPSPISHLPSPNTKEKKEHAPKREIPVRPSDVSEQVWFDWIALRIKKNATVTETVIAEARKEADKASLPFERFLAIWCMRGSQGLQAEWLKPSEKGKTRSTPTRPNNFGELDYGEQP